MTDLSLGALVGTLLVLIVVSAFFSGSETGLMALNRYRLRHLARVHPGAKRARRLLEQPDRVIGLIVLGNNFVNILASSLATWAALELFGEAGKPSRRSRSPSSSSSSPRSRPRPRRPSSRNGSRFPPPGCSRPCCGSSTRWCAP